MDWEVDFETFGSVLAIKASGVVRVEGFKEYTEATLADPRWRKGMPVLLDFRDLDTDQVKYPDILKIVDILLPYASAASGGRIAAVVSRPQDYGLIKIWEALAGVTLSTHTVCYTMDEALAFLRKSLKKGLNGRRGASTAGKDL